LGAPSRRRFEKFPFSQSRRLGTNRDLVFKHPVGIEYELVGVRRRQAQTLTTGSDVRRSVQFCGIHGTELGARDGRARKHEVRKDAMGCKVAGKQGCETRPNSIATRALVGIVEIVHDTGVPAGTWRDSELGPYITSFSRRDEEKQASCKGI